MTPGASLVKTLTTPLLRGCWNGDIVDWDLVDYVYDDLSRGEKALVALAQSLDGQGNCNIGVCLGDIDGKSRDLFVMRLAATVGQMVR